MQLITDVEMVNSVDDIKSSFSFQGVTPFPSFELLHVRIASALNKIIQNSYFKKKVSLEEQKTQKADRFLRGRQIAYLIYDYFWVTGVSDYVLDYADLFSCSSEWLHSGFRYKMRRNSTIYGTILTWWYSGKFVQIKKNTRVWKIEDRVGTVQLGNSSEESETWLSQAEDDGKRKYWAKFQGTEILRLEIGELSQTFWSRIRGNSVVFTKDKQNVGNGKLTGSVRKETHTVSGTMKNERKKATTQPAPSPKPSTQQNGKILRERTVLEAEVRLGECLVCRTRNIFKRYVCESILWKFAFRGKCVFAHLRVEKQPTKKVQKEWRQKCSCDVERDKEFWLCISGRGAAEIVIEFTEKLNHAENNPMCSIHQSCITQSHRSMQFVQEILISAAPVLQNLRVGLRKRRDGKSIGLAKQRGSWQSKSCS